MHGDLDFFLCRGREKGAGKKWHASCQTASELSELTARAVDRKHLAPDSGGIPIRGCAKTSEQTHRSSASSNALPRAHGAAGVRRHGCGKHAACMHPARTAGEGHIDGRVPAFVAPVLTNWAASADSGPYSLADAKRVC